jgi:hypothetical protein
VEVVTTEKDLAQLVAGIPDGGWLVITPSNNGEHVAVYLPAGEPIVDDWDGALAFFERLKTEAYEAGLSDPGSSWMRDVEKWRREGAEEVLEALIEKWTTTPDAYTQHGSMLSLAWRAAVRELEELAAKVRREGS